MWHSAGHICTLDTRISNGFPAISSRWNNNHIPFLARAFSAHFESDVVNGVEIYAPSTTDTESLIFRSLIMWCLPGEVGMLVYGALLDTTNCRQWANNLPTSPLRPPIGWPVRCDSAHGIHKFPPSPPPTRKQVAQIAVSETWKPMQYIYFYSSPAYTTSHTKEIRRDGGIRNWKENEIGDSPERFIIVRNTSGKSCFVCMNIIRLDSIAGRKEAK